MSDSGKTAAEMGAKGGKAAAARLSPAERAERAKKAAEARWAKESEVANGGTVPRAICGSPDRPLRIGGVEIPCYVLEDGRRVLTLNGMMAAMGMKKGAGEGGEGGNRIGRFATGKAMKSYVSPGVRDAVVNPIQFTVPIQPFSLANGFEATILADLCDSVLQARREGALMHHQAHIAVQCEILMSAFARVGIVALVDEATGYQYARTREELQRLLERYISKELARWQPTFDSDFYKHMFRLKEWRYDPSSSRRPFHAARITVDLVYHRIHPELLTELKQARMAWEQDGKKKGGKLHQFLTTADGHPRLRQHLEGVIVAMKLSKNWAEFSERMDMLYPKLNQTPSFPFFSEMEGETSETNQE